MGPTWPFPLRSKMKTQSTRHVIKYPLNSVPHRRWEPQSQFDNDPSRLDWSRWLGIWCKDRFNTAYGSWDGYIQHSTIWIFPPTHPFFLPTFDNIYLLCWADPYFLPNDPTGVQVQKSLRGVVFQLKRGNKSLEMFCQNHLTLKLKKANFSICLEYISVGCAGIRLRT